MKELGYYPGNGTHPRFINLQPGFTAVSIWQNEDSDTIIEMKLDSEQGPWNTPAA